VEHAATHGGPGAAELAHFATGGAHAGRSYPLATRCAVVLCRSRGEPRLQGVLGAELGGEGAPGSLGLSVHGHGKRKKNVDV
jgi:hypothetical protein